MGIATLPWADEDYRYFLLIVDVFSRYVEAIPLKDKKASSLVQEFKKGWIFRGHGVPKVLLSDQAKNVDGNERRELCDQLGIENAATKLSPQLLVYGRQPISPIDTRTETSNKDRTVPSQNFVVELKHREVRVDSLDSLFDGPFKVMHEMPSFK